MGGGWGGGRPVSRSPETAFDLVVVGAGINGAGIARDAAGRGLRVLLIDQGDIAGATSSASTKLVHGGLRYLEHRAFGLVRESLGEREILRALAPHLMREQRFVIPHGAGQRPRWMIRLGLALYDGLARGSSLPRAAQLRFADTPIGEPLRPEFADGFAYSDLATDDARLCVLNAVSAVQLGAVVRTRTRLECARRSGGTWQVTCGTADGAREACTARAIVNAAGPWVASVRQEILGAAAGGRLRLVQGSHIVVPRLYPGPQAYLLQQPDRRIVFAIPFEEDFTLVGTTEVPLQAPAAEPQPGAGEVDYLCAAVSRFFRQPLRPNQAVWSFSGIRALFDDGRGDPSAVTREYRLEVDGAPGEPPLLSVYGGKLTTYRHLAERVLQRLRPWLPGLRGGWTASVHLPGGGLGPGGLPALLLDLSRRHPRLPPEWLAGLARRHGTIARRVIGEAATEAGLGPCFGGGLYAREVDHLAAREWACTPDDILWRRTKCGLRVDATGRAALADYLAARRRTAP